MVIVLSSTEHSSLCGTRKQAPREENYTCRCFMKSDMLNSCHIPAKPFIEFFMPVHFTNKRSRKYHFTCSWSCIRRPQMQTSRMMDNCLICSLQHRDEHKIVKYSKSVSPGLKQIMGKHDIICQAVNGVDSKHLDSFEIYLSGYGIMEEPWLPQHSQFSHRPVDSALSDVLRDESKVSESLNRDIPVSNFSSNSTKDDIYSECEEVRFRASQESHYPDSISVEENDQVEEPWLVQSLVHSPSSDPNTAGDVTRSEESSVDRGTLQGSEGQNQKIHEKLLPVGENSLTAEEYSISTVILINSSICTMQRIAVLENGNLVELLLEPVKNNVLCDSVYLGVVTKLVPHMGGAFVNIGGPRPSLMDIRPNRRPFLFPPISYQTKGKDVNGSLCDKFADTCNILENGTISHVMEETLCIKDDEIDIDSEEFMDDDFGDHDNGGSWEDLKGNCNGSVHSGVAVEDDRYSAAASLNNHQPLGPDLDYPLTEDKVVCSEEDKWAGVRKGTKILVQVVKEELGTKGPTLTAYPKLRSRFWILMSRCGTIGISKKISGIERTRLRVIAKTLQPPGFGLTVRTVAAGHSLDELQEDLEGLLSTWKSIVEHAKSAALAANEGVDGAVPVMLHQAMGKTLSVVQDYFSDKVDSMIVDSPRIYHEVTNYLQEIAPDLCDRVELYNKASPLFDEYKIEGEIDSILSKRVTLSNGGYLVIEQTEALVSIDVNGGQCMLGKGTSKEKAILDVNLAAAKQIARELRLRDIGGIIVVDFIDMHEDSDKRLVYEEVKKAVERDRSMVKVSELSKYGLMEITRKRVRPSVTFMISEQCSCCSGIGRVVALETSFSKIEHEICRVLSLMDQKANPEDPSSWPSFVLRVDQYMCNYLTSGKRTKLAVLSSSLKVWILLKVDRGLSRGNFDLKPLGDDKESKQQNKSAIPILRTREVGTYNSPKRVTLFPIKKWSTRGK